MQDTGFSNIISSSDAKKIDYDLQSEDIITYEAGDVIAVYVENADNIKYSNVNTIIETTAWKQIKK